MGEGEEEGLRTMQELVGIAQEEADLIEKEVCANTQRAKRTPHRRNH